MQRRSIGAALDGRRREMVMDRIENVRRQRELARELLDWCEGGGSSVAIDYEAVAELAELVLALDGSQPQPGFQTGCSSAVREIGLARDAEAAA
jgi:hypothetical protein